MGFQEESALQLFTRLRDSPEQVLTELRRVDPEREHLDFKTVATTHAQFTAKKAKFVPDDVANLKRALSGFYNSLGGVIAWGIDCEGQGCPPGDRLLTGGRNPLVSADHLQRAIDSRRSNMTHPPIPGVQFSHLKSDDGEILLMFVPPREGRSPAMAVGDRYYFRISDKFEPVHPDFLAQMLGATPPPLFRVEFVNIRKSSSDSRLLCVVRLHNVGRGMAKDPYLLITRVQNGKLVTTSTNTKFFRTHNHPSDKEAASHAHHSYCAVAKADVRIPPNSSLVVAEFRLAPLTTLHFQAGAGSHVPSFGQWTAPQLQDVVRVQHPPPQVVIR